VALFLGPLGASSRLCFCIAGHGVRENASMSVSYDMTMTMKIMLLWLVFEENLEEIIQ
jgi:hypothetical protein